MDAILINFDEYFTNCAMAIYKRLGKLYPFEVNTRHFLKLSTRFVENIRNSMTFSLCIVKNIHLKLKAGTKLNISGNQTYQRLLSLISYCKLSHVSFLAHCNTLMNLLLQDFIDSDEWLAIVRKTLILLPHESFLEYLQHRISVFTQLSVNLPKQTHTTTRG